MGIIKRQRGQKCQLVHSQVREMRPRKIMELNTNFASTLLFTDMKLTNNEYKSTKFARVAGSTMGREGKWGGL